MTLGREAGNVVAITDPSVSRKHCLLRQEDERFQVCDLQSRNGTLVNGVSVKEQWLRHGDEIAVGDSIFLFLLDDESLVLPPSRVEFDEGHHTAETKLIHPSHRLPLWLTEDMTRRSLEPIVRRSAWDAAWHLPI